MIIKKCKVCGKQFRTIPSVIKRGRGIFCSRKCCDISRRGIVPKGFRPSPWNKGLKMGIDYPEGDWGFKKGQKIFISKTSRRRTGLKLRGSNHYLWKGENVGYKALHAWVRKYKGKPIKCEFCGKSNKERKLTWANKDHKYIRNLDDFISLCYSCHKKYDFKYNIKS